MAKTHKAMVAELARALERRGLIVERGPFVIATDDEGRATLIAENVVRVGQMRLPLDEAVAEDPAGAPWAARGVGEE